jgi:hypothetical protein
MPSAERKAKLPPSELANARPAAPPAESLARHMRVLGSVVQPVEQHQSHVKIPQASAASGSAPPQPGASDCATEEQNARKQALAADLEDMIGGMLQTARFAGAPAARTRSRQIREVAAPDASGHSSAFTANSLVADLAASQPAAEAQADRPAAPRRRWIDALLILACVLSVLSAGYFTLAP